MQAGKHLVFDNGRHDLLADKVLLYVSPVTCAQVRHRHRAYIPVDRLFQSKMRIEVVRVKV